MWRSLISRKIWQHGLSPRERAVKKAVEQKRVSWRVFNPDVEVDRQKIPIAADGTMSIASQASG